MGTTVAEMMTNRVVAVASAFVLVATLVASGIVIANSTVPVPPRSHHWQAEGATCSVELYLGGRTLRIASLQIDNTSTWCLIDVRYGGVVESGRWRGGSWGEACDGSLSPDRGSGLETGHAYAWSGYREGTCTFPADPEHPPVAPPPEPPGLILPWGNLTDP